MLLNAMFILQNVMFMLQNAMLMLHNTIRVADCEAHVAQWDVNFYLNSVP